MSILIKGMDMPTDCAGCDLSYYRDGYNGGYGYSPSGFRCRRLNHIIKEGEETRPPDCPLSEIHTPHGRLIDADRLIVALRNSVYANSFFRDPTLTVSQIKQLIEHQPTIIKVEE